MTGYHIYGKTECGPVRAANEDHILLGRIIKNRGGLAMQLARDDDFLERYGVICAVADGIGGEQGGYVASSLALETFQAQFYGAARDTRTDAAVSEALQTAADHANNTLLQLAAQRSDLANMGCTLAGVCVTPAGYRVFHAGDSRVYRYRNGALKQLTVDDSLVGIAVEAGYMTHQEAEQSAVRSTITNYLGSASFKLTIGEVAPLQNGELLLICSDGLHGVVDYDQCEGIISQNDTAERIGNALLEEAILRGAPDNTSAIVIQAA